jgi:hypothetical protein
LLGKSRIRTFFAPPHVAGSVTQRRITDVFRQPCTRSAAPHQNGRRYAAIAGAVPDYSLADIHAAEDKAFFTVCASHTFVPTATLRKMFDDLVDRIAA